MPALLPLQRIPILGWYLHFIAIYFYNNYFALRFSSKVFFWKSLGNFYPFKFRFLHLRFKSSLAITWTFCFSTPLKSKSRDKNENMKQYFLVLMFHSTKYGFFILLVKFISIIVPKGCKFPFKSKFGNLNCPDVRRKPGNWICIKIKVS